MMIMKIQPAFVRDAFSSVVPRLNSHLLPKFNPIQTGFFGSPGTAGRFGGLTTITAYSVAAKFARNDLLINSNILV